MQLQFQLLLTCGQTNSKKSFLSFTAYCFDNSFKYHHAVFQMKHFRETHTTNRIKNCLEEIPNLWDIDTIKIHAALLYGTRAEM